MNKLTYELWEVIYIGDERIKRCIFEGIESKEEINKLSMNYVNKKKKEAKKLSNKYSINVDTKYFIVECEVVNMLCHLKYPKESGE